MFYGYLILKVNNEEVLYLYLNNYEEFSNEFTNNLKKENLYDKISNYIKEHKINFNGKKIMFVVNGLIIGSLALTAATLNNLNSNEKPYTFLNINNDYIIENSKNETNIKIPKETEHKILVKTNNQLEKVFFNNYLISAISMKIPATYDIEGIKTIAVLTRTEAFKELYEKKYINNNKNLYQKEEVFKIAWRNNFEKFYNRIKKAVIETDNEYMSYHNYFLNTNPVKINNHYTIGISNYGINLLSKTGYNYKQILNHYYPNSKLTKL